MLRPIYDRVPDFPYNIRGFSAADFPVIKRKLISVFLLFLN